MPTTTGLDVRASGGGKVLLHVPPMELKRGSATTIVITGASKLSYFAAPISPERRAGCGQGA